MVFERYRSRVEPYLNERRWESYLHILTDPLELFSLGCLSEWAFRYDYRKQAIQQMDDGIAHHALRAMYFARDTAVQGDPDWNRETRERIETVYQNLQRMESGFEKSPDDAHTYGPSFRQLYIERRLAGNSHEDVQKSITEWSHHRPPAWEEEDRRKQHGLDYATEELGKHLTRELSWRTTSDVECPYATEVAGATWHVCLNDFPDDLLYTLIINDSVIGKFHDWPKRWQRVDERGI